MNMDALRDSLKQHEGLRVKPYQDTVGKWTIGFGRNLTDVGISVAEAEMLLAHDVAQAIAECRRAFVWFDGLDEVRQRVLVELCFNMGLPTLLTFVKTLGSVAAGDYDTAATQLVQSKWARQVGGRRSMRLARMLRTGVDA